MNSLMAFCVNAVADRAKSWAPIPLRLIVGYGFVDHGYSQLVRGLESFTRILHAISMPGASLLAWVTVVVEILGGLSVLVGAFIPIVSVPMATVLLVATFTVHLPNGFSSIKLESYAADGAHFGPPGYETDLLYLACLATLALGGPGPLSLDRLLFGRRAETPS